MRKLVAIIVVSLVGFRALAQVAIQADKMNILYMCVANPLTIAAANTSSKSLVVTTDNGRIQMDSFGRKGAYTIWPDRVGYAVITVRKKTLKGLKVISKNSFRVKSVPQPSTKFAGRKGGEISKAELCVQIAPSTDSYNFDNDLHYPISSYRVRVFRRRREIFSRLLADRNHGRIDATTNDFFHKLCNNDKVIFSDFEIDGSNCFISNKLSDSMIFTITDAFKYHKPHRPKHGQETIIDPVTGEEMIKKW